MGAEVSEGCVVFLNAKVPHQQNHGDAGMENPPMANMQDAAENIHTFCTNFLESFWLRRQVMWLLCMTCHLPLFSALIGGTLKLPSVTFLRFGTSFQRHIVPVNISVGETPVVETRFLLEDASLIPVFGRGLIWHSFGATAGLTQVRR